MIAFPFFSLGCTDSVQIVGTGYSASACGAGTRLGGKNIPVLTHHRCIAIQTTLMHLIEAYTDKSSKLRIHVVLPAAPAHDRQLCLAPPDCRRSLLRAQNVLNEWWDRQRAIFCPFLRLH